MKALICAVACSLAPFNAVNAATCSVQSPSHTVALLELYTSEGCSSCPPADRFVGGLRAASGLEPERLVVLSLHVDYWDDLGWKDAYGKRAFTQRQRWLSDAAHSRTVYTPEIFLGGRELRDWRNAVPAAVRRINEQPARAAIGISLSTALDSALHVEVNATTSQRADLFIALYENGLASQVDAGENRGERLRHEYVVRDLLGPIALAAGAPMSRVALPRAIAVPPSSDKRNLGVAAFVQSPQGEVLQAAELPLCRASP